MDRFLCPIDFSPYSINALEYAIKLLEVRKGSLTLIHVFTEDEYFHSEGEKPSFVDMKNHQQQKLNSLANEYEEKYGIDCTVVMSLGEINNSISKYAHHNNFDLIVMGTQGNGYTKNTVIGSRTLQTVEDSLVPVLAVPLEVKFKGLDSVIYASDYSDEDKIVVQKVVSFVYSFRSRIRFVHVSRSTNKMNEKTYQDFKDELSSFVGYDKISYYLKEYKEDISSGIDEFVKEHQGDLVVLLKRRRNFFEKLLSSSISTEISYLSAQPLLIYREST